ncbi:MAG TPA: transketolase [Terriglobales bacterium]|jgi:transketolase|nr:transketolase [Terriglobales bacterium]
MAVSDQAVASSTKIELLSINTIRTLSMDGVQKANSGHPGTPMALAPAAYTLWQQFLRYDPEDPLWPNRDRFVLSNGHASMLLYSVLHLAGVRDVNKKGEVQPGLSISLDDLKRFRQIDSKTAGHPEYGAAAGIETTTGPLGQGVATSVGMAIAGRWLAANFNRPGFELFNYRTWVFCGDGDLMEGVSSEAASVAGHLKLSNLCWLYDNNKITIEGKTELAFSEDVAARFKSYGWDVTHVLDANDLEQLSSAYHHAAGVQDRPQLIIVDSHIGYGSPNRQDTKEAHGEALGEEEVKLTKRAYGWPEDAQFLVPDGVRENFREGVGKRGKQARDQWTAMFNKYGEQFPDLAGRLGRMQHHQLPDGWDKDLPSFAADAKGVASRESSSKVLNALAKNIPWLLGGAADLYPSTKTRLTFEGAGDFEANNYQGRNFHFGIREHTMGAIVNGMTLCNLRAYGSTFFIFTDYMKPAMRLSALMEIPAIWIFTHDSIGLGEDGPTHQSIEQLVTLRAVPNMTLLRPGDANEVVEAYKVIMKLQHEPATLVLTRQNLPTLDRTKYASATGVARGAYILADSEGGKLQIILIGTGSELSLCVDAYEKLKQEGVRARVVSMPSWDIFERQDQAYRDQVLPPDVTARLAVEAGSTVGWSQYVGTKGKVIGMRSFGASAPLKDVMKKFGFTVENVLKTARELVAE